MKNVEMQGSQAAMESQADPPMMTTEKV